MRSRTNLNGITLESSINNKVLGLLREYKKDSVNEWPICGSRAYRYLQERDKTLARTKKNVIEKAVEAACREIQIEMPGEVDGRINVIESDSECDGTEQVNTQISST